VDEWFPNWVIVIVVSLIPHTVEGCINMDTVSVYEVDHVFKSFYCVYFAGEKSSPRTSKILIAQILLMQTYQTKLSAFYC
jgi:hypothetical protein